MQPFCLRFGEEVNTSLSQQLHRSTTYGTRGVGVGWDWRLHFNCAYQNIWIFGQMLGKRERCVFGIRERGKIKKMRNRRKTMENYRMGALFTILWMKHWLFTMAFSSAANCTLSNLWSKWSNLSSFLIQCNDLNEWKKLPLISSVILKVIRADRSYG